MPVAGYDGAKVEGLACRLPSRSRTGPIDIGVDEFRVEHSAREADEAADGGDDDREIPR